MSATKRIINNTVVLTLRMFVTMGISIYSSRIILQALGVVDYGIYNVIGGVISMFSFLNTSMIASTQRFLNYSIGKGEYKDVKKILNTSINLHIILSVIVLFVSEIIGIYLINHSLTIPSNRLFAANIIFQFAVISTIINIMSIPYKALIIAHEKMNIYAYEAIFNSFATLLISFAILYYGGDKLILYSSLLMIIGLLIRVFDGWYCAHRFSFHYKFFIDRTIITELISFSGWSTLVTLAHFLYTQCTIILLNIFFGPAINSAQSLANQINLSLMTFGSNFIIAVKPQIIKSYAKQDFQYLRQLVLSSLKVSCIIMGIVVSPFLLKADYILKLWLHDVPEYTKEFLVLVLILSVIISFSDPITTTIQATGKIKNYQISESLFLISILPCTFILYKLGYQPYSTYWIRIMIFLILLCVRLYFLKPVLNINIHTLFFGVIVKTSFCVILSFGIMYFFSQCISDSLIGVIILCSISLVLNASLGFFFLFKKNEKIYLINLIRNKINLKKNN